MHKIYTKINTILSPYFTSWYCVQNAYGDEFWTNKLTLEVMVESFYTDARTLQMASITSAWEFPEVTVIKGSQPCTQNGEMRSTSHSTFTKNSTSTFVTVDLSMPPNSRKHLMLGRRLAPRKIRCITSIRHYRRYWSLDLICSVRARNTETKLDSQHHPL